MTDRTTVTVPDGGRRRMTSAVDRLCRADRERLLERLAELRELADLMRESGTLAAPDEPPALHGMGETAP